MDLRIQFSNSKEKMPCFEKLCEGYKQFKENSIDKKGLINLFKEAKKEHLVEYAETKQIITELQKNSLQKT